MTPGDLVAQLARQGIELRIHGAQLQACGDLESLHSELRDELRRRASAVRAYVKADTAWAEAISEISAAWERTGRIGWLDDRDLIDAVGDALRSDEPEDAFAAIETWRSAWLRFLNQPSPGGGSQPTDKVTPADDDSGIPRASQ